MHVQPSSVTRAAASAYGVGEIIPSPSVWKTILMRLMILENTGASPGSRGAATTGRAVSVNVKRSERTRARHRRMDTIPPKAEH